MVQDAVAAIPDDGSVEALSTPVGDHAGAFKEYLLYWRSEISFALLGQNQSSEQDSTHASAKAGLEVTSDIRDALADMVTGAINTLIAWIAELNSYAGPLPVWEMWEQEEVDEIQAGRDAKLKQAGASFTNQYFERAYGFHPGDLAAPPPPPTDTPPPTLAQPAEDPEPGTPAADVPPLVEALGEQADQLIQGWLEPIRLAMAEAKDLDDFGERLLQLYPEIDSSQFATLMGQAIQLADLRGREAIRAG